MFKHIIPSRRISQNGGITLTVIVIIKCDASDFRGYLPTELIYVVIIYTIKVYCKLTWIGL